MERLLFRGIVVLLGLSIGTYAPAIGTAFLTIPSNPRELALGGSTSSIAGDPSLARGNPALIVQTFPAMEIGFGYNAWFAGARGTSVLITQPAFHGTLGFGVRSMGISDLELRPSRPTDEYDAHFTVSGIAVEGIWGRQFDRLRLGGTLRWIRIESYVYNSSGLSVDLGAWWPLMRNRISIGASVRNLGSMGPMLYENPSLPVTFQTGITFRVTSGKETETHQLQSLMTVGAEISDKHRFVARVAGEVVFGEVRITLGTRLSEEVTEVAGAVNLRLRLFQVSYGLAIGSHQLGIPHLFHVKARLP